MTVVRRAPAGLVASSVFVIGLFHASAAVASDLLVNAKTGKCLTIAGGVSTANNVEPCSSTATAIRRAAGR